MNNQTLQAREVKPALSITEKAKQYSDLFTSKKREDGSIYVVTALEGEQGYNEDLKEAIREAHGDRLPDDWIYSTFADLLQRVAEYDLNTIDDLEDVRGEIVDSYTDVYTKDLTAWLNDDIRNVYYLTQAIEEYQPEDGFKALAMAQYLAIDEVMQSVINLLGKEQA